MSGARSGILPDMALSLSPGFGGLVVSRSDVSPRAPTGRLRRWLLAEVVEDVPGPEAKEGRGEQDPWWQIVCLTGVDYFYHPRLHPWNRCARGRGALTHSHALHSALDPLRGAADVQAGGRGEPQRPRFDRDA